MGIDTRIKLLHRALDLNLQNHGAKLMANTLAEGFSYSEGVLKKNVVGKF